MGVDNFYFSKLKEVIDKNFDLGVRKKVVCLGYPDFLVGTDLLVSLYGDDFVKTVPVDPDKINIQKWHKYDGEVYDPSYIFNFHNFDMIVIDKIKHRGNEILADLNFNLDKSLHRSFDLLIDTGTLEHCFNVGTAFKNMCDLIKVGGVIMTCAPVSKINHGYYNFCPIMYDDGFITNGFDLLEKIYINKKGQTLSEPNSKHGIENRSVMIGLAKRVNDIEFVFPIQRKYI